MGWYSYETLWFSFPFECYFPHFISQEQRQVLGFKMWLWRSWESNAEMHGNEFATACLNGTHPNFVQLLREWIYWIRCARFLRRIGQFAIRDERCWQSWRCKRTDACLPGIPVLDCSFHLVLAVEHHSSWSKGASTHSYSCLDNILFDDTFQKHSLTQMFTLYKQVFNPKVVDNYTFYFLDYNPLYRFRFSPENSKHFNF